MITSFLFSAKVFMEKEWSSASENSPETENEGAIVAMFSREYQAWSESLG